MRFRKLEKRGKKIRSLLSPKSRASYQALKNRTVPKVAEGRGYVALDIKEMNFDFDGGRYYYYLIKDIFAAGYTPIIKDHYEFLSSFPHKRYKNPILDLKVWFYHELPKEKVALLITDNTKEPSLDVKTVTLDYKSGKSPCPSSVEIPYCSHPNNLKESSELLELRAKHPREKTVFFAGAFSRPKYANPILRKKYDLIPKAEAVELILKAIEAGDLDASQLSIHYRPEDRIPMDQWMKTIGNSSFFLAFPGVDMPLSHNLIEALSVGTIPILQYNQHLTPALKDGLNCLTYSDEQSLIDTIKTACTLPTERIQKMSEAVTAYYKKNLKLGSFTNALLSQDKKKARSRWI